MSSHFARLNTPNGHRVAVNAKAIRTIHEVVGEGAITCKLAFGREEEASVTVVGSLDEVMEKLDGHHHHKDHHHPPHHKDKHG